MKVKIMMMALLVGSSSLFAGLYRDYNKPLTHSDQHDIRYIVTNLSTSSMINIMFNKSNIERAGDRIDPVHPLQFLLCIFGNEELKASIHNIRNRTIIWKDFYEGLRESLQTESSEHNFDHHVADFASKLKVNPTLLTTAAKEKRWDKFLDVLFTQIPRNPDRNRYDD